MRKECCKYMKIVYENKTDKENSGTNTIESECDFTFCDFEEDE